MKKPFIFPVIILLIPCILAINIDIEKKSSNEVMIFGIKKPVTFDLELTNNGATDYFEFYNLLGFEMYPVGTILINAGETKEFQLKVSPIGEFDHRGYYTFEYFIMGQDDTKIKGVLTFKIVDLKDAFEIGSGEVDPSSNSVEIYIQNKVNFNFGEISARFSSAFFNFEETFELGQNKRKSFDIQLNKEDFKKLLAGFYTLTAEIKAQDQKADIEGIIKFIEENIVTSTKKDYGLIISTKIIEKTNEGNVVSPSETTIKKNIISRLFTSFSPEPDIVEREALVIYYTWNNEIKPGETLEINVKTNWLLPLLIILFIVIIVLLAKQYSKTNLVIKKRVSFVKAKGGEFALKVSIFLNAKKYLERVNIIDRLPPLVKIYERFGAEKPSKIDEKSKKLEWTFEKLEAGEIRVLSYIIYSKVGVLGKFALPTATAIYEKEGKVRETISNRTFFVAEQRTKDIEEE
ncbi:MAG: hypothetical protein KKF48_01545 [Nanoarchaeota archaeon]|nr:hypothetical protein [Nanoarchaeota archaeon]MBU1027705.1 hypothetical protein [Nanoarchaeota archaeon]